MIIFTIHWKERVIERYSWIVKQFIKFSKNFFKKIRTKKITNHKIKKWVNWNTSIYRKHHKIVYDKHWWNYIIISYWVRVSPNVYR